MKAGKKKKLTAVEASRRCHLHGDKNAILKFYRYHPEMLDPHWENENPEHHDVKNAHLLRMQFCWQMGNGDFEYRFTGEKEGDHERQQAAEWPYEANEKELLQDLKKTNYKPQQANLPIHLPWFSRLKVLVPSAVHAFRNGNQKAVLDLARIIPGLLMVHRDEKGNVYDENEFKQYLHDIAEFQLCFRMLISNKKLRTARHRKKPSGMENRYDAVEAILEAGIDTEIAYAVLRYSGNNFANIATDRSKIKKQIRKKEDEWFFGGAKLYRECREKGVLPDKLQLSLKMAEWIIIQHKCRLKIQQIIDEINKIPVYDLPNNTEAVELKKKCKKIMDGINVIPLPSYNELITAAANYWPGLINKKPEYNVKQTAIDLLKIFHIVSSFKHLEKNTYIYNLFYEAAFRYNAAGYKETINFLNDLQNTRTSGK